MGVAHHGRPNQGLVVLIRTLRKLARISTCHSVLIYVKMVQMYSREFPKNIQCVCVLATMK